MRSHLARCVRKMDDKAADRPLLRARGGLARRRSTLRNGMANSGYIPDASFGHQTFEVLSSRLPPGCAETTIVNGIVGMMPKAVY